MSRSFFLLSLPSCIGPKCVLPSISGQNVSPSVEWWRVLMECPPSVEWWRVLKECPPSVELPFYRRQAGKAARLFWNLGNEMGIWGMGWEFEGMGKYRSDLTLDLKTRWQHNRSNHESAVHFAVSTTRRVPSSAIYLENLTWELQNMFPARSEGKNNTA